MGHGPLNLEKIIGCELNKEKSKVANVSVSNQCLEAIVDVFPKIPFESLLSLRLQRHQKCISSEIQSRLAPCPGSVRSLTHLFLRSHSYSPGLLDSRALALASALGHSPLHS